jgi:hypothetical protein
VRELVDRKLIGLYGNGSHAFSLSTRLCGFLATYSRAPTAGGKNGGSTIIKFTFADIALTVVWFLLVSSAGVRSALALALTATTRPVDPLE